MFALAAVGGAALAVAQAASAQTAAPASSAASKPPMTRTELVQKIAEQFKEVDANHDGVVTRLEIDAEIGKRANEAEQAIKKRQQEEFQKLDTNKDGQLSLAEYQGGAIIKARAGAGDERLKQLDTNKDGKITQAEFGAEFLSRFDKIDTNKDGTLSAQEIAAATRRAPAKAATKR
jgi:Ca2+-binding EF-hand superfamily protein